MSALGVRNVVKLMYISLAWWSFPLFGWNLRVEDDSKRFRHIREDIMKDNRELMQTRRRRLTIMSQKKKALISKTMTLHVCYTFWYISLPSRAQLQREMTIFKVLC